MHSGHQAAADFIRINLKIEYAELLTSLLGMKIKRSQNFFLEFVLIIPKGIDNTSAFRFILVKPAAE